MNELYDKYPKYKKIKGIELQRWKICPVGVQSDHNDLGVVITSDTADKLSKEIEHSPLLYGKASLDGLPKNHGESVNDEYTNRTVVGTGLGGSVITDENGTKWLVGDYAVYTDANKDIVERIKQFKDDVSSSYELNSISYDDDGNVVEGSFKGTAIMDKDYSAYHHKALLIAEKSDVKEGKIMDDEAKELLKKIYDVLTVSTAITVKEAVKEVEEDIKKAEKEIEGSENDIKYAEQNLKEEKVQPVMDNKKWQEDTIKNAEKRIKEKEEEIEKLKEENSKLRELTNGFVNLSLK